MAYLQRQAGDFGGPIGQAELNEQAWLDFMKSPRARRVTQPEHEVVFFEGDVADRIFEVTDGAVMLFKLLPDGRRQVVEILGAGDLFGFQAAAHYDCSAETLLASRLTVVNRHDAEEITELQSHISRCLITQIQTMHEHAVLLGRKSAFERVASFLMRFVPHRGVVGCIGPSEGKDEKVIMLAMTRQEIADYLGLTIETVSRVFSDLRRRKLITAEKHDRVRILDVCGICKLTGTR